MLKITANNFVEGVPVVPTPNKSGAIRPRLLIVHDTAGGLDYKGSVAWLTNPQAKASAHFVVGRNGEVVQLASCLVKCWHAGASSYKGEQNVNDFSIGIEIANPGKLSRAEGSPDARSTFSATYNIKKYGIEFRDPPTHGRGWWMPYSAPQLEAVFALAMAIRDRYEITKVAAHFEISPGRKIDVNPLFPLESLKGRMLGRQDDYNIVEVAVGTPVRQWPSLFESNILGETVGATAKLITSGEYYPAGENLPAEWVANPEKKILWYKIASGDQVGWVLADKVKMI